MSTYYNNVKLSDIVFNGTDLEELYYNNVLVFSKKPTAYLNEVIFNYKGGLNLYDLDNKKYGATKISTKQGIPVFCYPSPSNSLTDRVLSIYTDANKVYLNANSQYTFKDLWKSSNANIEFYNCLDGYYAVNMVGTFSNCTTIDGEPFSSNSVVNMSEAYSACSNITGSPKCGSNVEDFSATYEGCANLTGNPVCGGNVVNMNGTYYKCSGLTGSPVCGNKVVDFSSAYIWCHNLNGSPVCGPNVTTMANTYWNCSNLTGSPVCGTKVTNMYYAYCDCSNLTGETVCGKNVTDMYMAYAGCANLEGVPAVGSKVNNLGFAFAGCPNLYGDIYLTNNASQNADDYYARNCFEGRNRQNRLNIFVPKESGWNNWLYNVGTLTSSVPLDWEMVNNTTGSWYVNDFYNIAVCYGIPDPYNMIHFTMFNNQVKVLNMIVGN